MTTMHEINAMTPEELEAHKRKLSVGIFTKFALLFAFKLGVNLSLQRWAKKLR